MALSHTKRFSLLRVGLHRARQRIEERQSKLEQEIRDRQATQAALWEVGQQLQIVTDSMAAPVTRCSRDLRHLWVSGPYACWINRAPADIIDRPIVDVIGQDAFAELPPHFEQALSGQEVQNERSVNLKGIGQRWITAVYTPTHDRIGAVDGWVAVVVDITERKQMELSPRQADRRKDEFIATLAHELRTPLAPVVNALDRLNCAEDDPLMLKEARQIMDRQLRPMVRLIDDLLDVSTGKNRTDGGGAECGGRGPATHSSVRALTLDQSA